MKRLAVSLCGTALSVAALAGCGSDDGGGGDSESAGGSSGGDYCGQVEEMKGGFEDLSSGDASLSDMRSTVDLVGDIAGSAPSDISSEWESVHSTLDDVVSGLEDTGIAADKPLATAAEEYAKKNPDEAQKMLAEFKGVQSDMQKIESDGDAIEKHVKEECDIDLGSGSGSE